MIPDAGEAKGSCVSWVANADVIGVNGFGFASSNNIGSRQYRSFDLFVQNAGAPGMIVCERDSGNPNNAVNEMNKASRLIMSTLTFEITVQSLRVPG